MRVLLCLVVCLASFAPASAITVEKYRTWTITFTTNTAPTVKSGCTGTLPTECVPTNPYDNYLLRLNVTRPNLSVMVVDGFYDDLDGAAPYTWKARISPDAVGNWSWTTVTGDQTSPAVSWTFASEGSCNLGTCGGAFAVANATPTPDPGPIERVGQYFQWKATAEPVFLYGNFLDIGSPTEVEGWSQLYMSETPLTDTNRTNIRTRHQNTWKANKIAVYYANVGDYDTPVSGVNRPTTPWTTSAANLMNLSRWALYDQYLKDIKTAGMIAQMWFFADDSSFNAFTAPQQQRLVRYALARHSAYSHTMFVLALETNEGCPTCTQISTASAEALGSFASGKNVWGRLLSSHQLQSYNNEGDDTACGGPEIGCTTILNDQPWMDFWATQISNCSNDTEAARRIRMFDCSKTIYDTWPELPHSSEEFGACTSTAGQNAICRELSWIAFLTSAAAGTGTDWESLSEFITASRVPFHRMAPDASVITGGTANGYARVEVGEHYLIYKTTTATSITVTLPAGTYNRYWWNPADASFTIDPDGTVGAGATAHTPPSSTGSHWVLFLSKGNNLLTSPVRLHPDAATDTTTVASNDRFVRTDGNDACDGRQNVGGSSGACAKRTIKAAVDDSTCGCGCTVYVGPGNFYESTGWTQNSNCTPTNRKTVRGSGDTTKVFLGLSAPITCTPIDTALDFTYSCTIPTGGLLNTAAATINGRHGLCMTLGTTKRVDEPKDIDLEWKPDYGFTVNEFICLTPTQAQTSGIDHDDGGVCVGGSEPGSACRVNGDCSGSGTCPTTYESNLDSANGRGFWYAAAGTCSVGGASCNVAGATCNTTGTCTPPAGYIINPWSELTEPDDAGITVHAPMATTTPPIILNNQNSQVENLTVYQGIGGAGVSFADSGDGSIASDIIIHSGSLEVGTARADCALNNPSVNRVKIYNAARRDKGKGCGELGNSCNDTSDTEGGGAAGIRGCGTVVDGLTAIGGHEGTTFQGQNQNVRNVHVSSFINHGFRADNVWMNTTLENVLTYNNQEGFFTANCLQNITFKHMTIGGTVAFNGVPGPLGSFYNPCPSGINGYSGLRFYNSILGKISHNDAYCEGLCAGGTRNGLRCFTTDSDPDEGCPGGVCQGWYDIIIHARDANNGQPDNDYNNNVYFDADGDFITDYRCPAAGGVEDLAFTTIAAWRAHATDLCTSGCIRDTVSLSSTKTALFNNPDEDDLDDASPPDWTLKAGSLAINLGDDAFAPFLNKDITGTTRDGDADAGAYEYVVAACDNDNAQDPGEECDGTDLDGFDDDGVNETCTSLGHTGGSPLLCYTNCATEPCCQFNETNCTDTDTTAPNPVTTLAVGTPTTTTCPLTWTDTFDDGGSGAFGAGSEIELRYRSAALGGIDNVSEFRLPDTTRWTTGMTAPVAGQPHGTTITGLEPDTDYDIAILILDEANNPLTLTDSPSSLDYVTCHTAGDSTAPDPIALVSASPTNTTCQLSWTMTYDDANLPASGPPATNVIKRSTATITGGSGANPFAGGGTPGTSTITGTSDGTCLAYPVTPAGGATQCTIVTGLAPGTTHHFMAQTCDDTPNCTFSADATCTTSNVDTTDPNPVVNLTVGTPTASSRPVTWNDPGDDGSSGDFPSTPPLGQTILKYRIDDGTAGSGLDNKDEFALASQHTMPAPGTAGAARSATIPGLLPDTDYDIAVLIRDEAGNPVTLVDADLDYVTCHTDDVGLPITNPETVTGADIQGGGVK